MPKFILDTGTPEADSAFRLLDGFTQGYIEALFFTETGTGDDGDLQNATVAELAPEALDRIKRDCAAFQATAAWQAWREYTGGALDSRVKAGRDFWYTRNGHGCGFWDGDWPEPHAAALTAAAESFGEVNDVYRADDGRVYLS